MARIRNSVRYLALLVATGIAAPAVSSPAPDAPAPPDAAPSPNVCLRGTGSFGWCGDGRAAPRAKLAGPQDVTVAPDGSMVIADTRNQVIRRVTAAGIISTIAGAGVRGDAR